MRKAKDGEEGDDVVVVGRRNIRLVAIADDWRARHLGVPISPRSYLHLHPLMVSLLVSSQIGKSGIGP